MNQQHAKNLSTEDYVRMFECDAKSELELALFSRLIEYLDQDMDTVTEEFDAVFGTMEEAITDAENELDDIMDNHPDDISDPVAKRLHDLAVQLAEVNEVQREKYDNIEYGE